ncbi:MAG: DUF3365 domain-containing protein [Planctomycetes bacterium]|nr:DUF3365 domain-containing protein [Planctomycetota bacterium]
MFKNLKLSAKLALGFGVMMALIVMVAVTVFVKVKTVNKVQNRVTELRQPTAMAGKDMLNGINHSLAALRGYMILGKDKFKNERANAWSKEIEPALASMNEFAVNWTDPQNIERLRTIESKLGDFKRFQQEIEDICQAVENTPAMKVLLEDAAPKAKVLAANITIMIDAEAQYDTSSIITASQVGSSAIELAKVVAEQVTTDRAFYTKNVIGKLKKESENFKAGSNYHETTGSIPLPATFVRETSESLGENAGYSYDLLSKWNINKDKGLSDAFENNAWESLSRDPKTPYAEFISTGSGVAYRYATADLANAKGCVSCHNEHQNSPKKDFKHGDLMGILVVTSAVTQDRSVAKILLDLESDNSAEGIGQSVRKLADDIIVRKSLLGMMADVRGTLGLGLGAIRGFLLSGDTKFETQFESLWTKNTQRFEDLTANVDLLIPEQRKAFKIFSETRSKFAPLPPKMFEIRNGQEWNFANTWLGTKAAPTAFAIKKNLEAMADSQQQLMSDDTKTLTAQSAALIRIVIIVAFVGLVAGVLIAWRNIRSITKPINKIIAGLTEGSDQVTSAATQVSSASQSLAEGATEQAAGLEETSSSLEEMASMTKQNADNAQQANTLAADARKAADTGNESMGRMNTAIQDIQKSSDETAKIIKVIDEIAFQTNLLALNAAVEAARAGEAGKGFAVVAEEVRNLAMRSAEAAKDTSGMIEESVKNANNGVEIAGEVSKILEEIVEGIGKTTDLVGEIAAASQEQSQGIDQVNTAVNQMDKVTQANAANAEESASASEELSAQAEQMNSIVDELSALVGGSSQVNTNSHSRTLKTSDHTFHQIAGGAAKAQTNQESAEKVIPLGDSDDFKGFNS